MNSTIIKTSEYLAKGDYHKNLDKNWRFYPVYLAKMKLVENFLNSQGYGKKILDLGCGEGILVSKYREKEYDIIGLDFNYQSELVLKGNVIGTGFSDSFFDMILCLDVIEHLSFTEQEQALNEIKRILKSDGLLVMTIPNLAHFASRISFLFAGRLLRTSEIERHIGDRPIIEYLKMLKKKRFIISQRKGIFPTFPVSSLLTYFFPSKILWLHKILNKFFAYPNWCFLNFIICLNKK